MTDDQLTDEQVDELLHSKMELFEFIDLYILENHQSLGSTFHRRDVQAWAEREGYTFDVGTALTAHRQTPKKRTFTTKRVGMGPNSHYEIVEVVNGTYPKAVREIHKQSGLEAVKRWANEMRFRMLPLAQRNKKALELLDKAETEMTLVASIFDINLKEMLDDEFGEEAEE